MSIREELSDQVLTLINELGLNTSPSAGCTGISADKKYRSVSLGWARWLDGEVRIYGPKYFLYRDSRNRQEVLRSFDELKAYLQKISNHSI